MDTWHLIARTPDGVTVYQLPDIPWGQEKRGTSDTRENMIHEAIQRARADLNCPDNDAAGLLPEGWDLSLAPGEPNADLLAEATRVDWSGGVPSE